MIHNAKCRAHHCSEYAIRPSALMRRVAEIRSGAYVAADAPPMDEATEVPDRVPLEIRDGIGLIVISGVMMKGWSKYAEADTMAIRKAVRTARQAPDVRGLMLMVDSPGGGVAGVQTLRDEVAQAATEMPVHAYCDDLTCSAGYWVASPAHRISGNRGALVGSVGAFAVIEDTSKMAEGLGVEVHVIQSGPMKAGAVDGVPVSEEVLAETQRIVDAFAADFFDSVSAGRNLTGARLDAVTTGEVWGAAEAVSLGLMDAVESQDVAMDALRKAVAALPTPARDSASARMRIARGR